MGHQLWVCHLFCFSSLQTSSFSISDETFWVKLLAIEIQKMRNPCRWRILKSRRCFNTDRTCDRKRSQSIPVRSTSSGRVPGGRWSSERLFWAASRVQLRAASTSTEPERRRPQRAHLLTPWSRHESVVLQHSIPTETGIQLESLFSFTAKSCGRLQLSLSTSLPRDSTGVMRVSMSSSPANTAAKIYRFLPYSCFLYKFLRLCSLFSLF